MNSALPLLFPFLCLGALACPAQIAKPTPAGRIALWPGKAPIGGVRFEECARDLEVFLPPAPRRRLHPPCHRP